MRERKYLRNGTFFMLWVLLTVVTFPCVAQMTEKADRWFEQGAYYKALSEYCRLMAEEPGTTDAGYTEYRAGICCLRMNRYRHAREWLEKADRLGFRNEELPFMLGEVLLAEGYYKEAKASYERYISLVGEDPLVKARIASCDFGRKAPVASPEVKVEALPYINTRGSEYGVSFVPGGILYSSTGDLLPERRSEVSQRTGMGYSRPYLSLLMDGEYEAGHPLRGVRHAEANEGSFSFDPVNRQLYCTRCEEDMRNCRIVVARLKDYAYRETGELKIGRGDYNIAHPFVTPEGNRIYFSSTMEGGYGGADIWYMDRDVSGGWGMPVNMGPDVNTVGNEIFPYVWHDIFFFASDGHPGYGGFDLFRTVWQNSRWAKPENLGAAFNTSYDDFNLIVGNDGKTGLLVSNRVPDRSDDIYRFMLLRPLDTPEVTTVPEESPEKEPPLVAAGEAEQKDGVVDWVDLRDTVTPMPGFRSPGVYRMQVASGDVSQQGWWVQVAMLMQSRIIEYGFAKRVTELSGRNIVMYRGHDGGHRFYIGVYEDEDEARQVVSLLKGNGFDCFIKRVGKER